MKIHLIGCGWFAIFLAAVVFLSSSPAAQNAAKSAKVFCIGCSVDGKATPRTSDGHPDLSEYWNNNAFNDFVERTEDGSLLYNFGGGPSKKRSPYGFAGYAPGEQVTQPSYKPEFAAKVKAIADNEYGASTPLDPQYDCKPLGVPRSMEAPYRA